MGKRSRGSSSASSGRLSSVPSSASASTSASHYGTMIDLTPVSEGKAGGGGGFGLPIAVSAAPKSAPMPGDKNIWDEYYPLIQPPNQYHQRGDGSTSNFFFHGMYSAEVMWAYRDAVLAFLVALYSMVVLSLTGLVFCKQWGMAPCSPAVFAFRALWFVSPAIASLALRNSTSSARLGAGIATFSAANSIFSHVARPPRDSSHPALVAAGRHSDGSDDQYDVFCLLVCS